MWLGASNTTKSARDRARRLPMSVRRNAWAPPCVDDHSAWSGVIPIKITASDITNGIEVVYEDPGLQSVASATVTPCSIMCRACGSGPRVHNSAAGNNVATVVLFALDRASISSSVMCVQWSHDATPNSTPNFIAPLGANWLAWIRVPRPALAPAFRISRDCSSLNAPRSQNTSIHFAWGRHAFNISPTTKST